MIMLNRTKVSLVVNPDSLITFFLILVLLASFAGLLLTGCGGESGPGLTTTDAGWPKCEIPSPTGDQKSSLYGVARDTPNYVVVVDTLKPACEGSKAWNEYESKFPYEPGYVQMSSGIDCSDPADNFIGTSTYPWCLNLIPNSDITNVTSSSFKVSGSDGDCTGSPTDGTTGSYCLAAMFSNKSGSVSAETCRGDGPPSDAEVNSPSCMIAAISSGPTPVPTVLTGPLWAVCSQSGVFLGWSCS
jgi:hypothetical protein